MWSDMVAICRDHISSVALVTTDTVSGVSGTVNKKGIPSVVEASSANKRGASSSAKVPAPASKVVFPSFLSTIALKSCC